MSFAIRACAGFAQLGAVTFQPFLILNDLLKTRMTGARGVSVMFSSGDSGVGGVGDGKDGVVNSATEKCLSNDGRNVTEFIPVFPASYVIFIIVSMVNVLTPIKNRCP
jgi:tripeptidyl-peptidase I